MFLLHATAFLNATKKNLLVAHVNYHSRFNCDDDTRIVTNFCKKHDLPLAIFHVRTKSTGNFESYARDLRYNFFASLVKTKNVIILLGHHFEDHLATFCLQQKRFLMPNYYGLKRFSTYKGVAVFRPLLSFHKKELTDYLLKNKIRFATDITNNDLTYERNKINLALKTWPYLQKLEIAQTIKRVNSYKFKQVNLIEPALTLANSNNVLNYNLVANATLYQKVLVLKLFLSTQLQKLQLPFFKYNFSWLVNFINIIEKPRLQKYFYYDTKLVRIFYFHGLVMAMRLNTFKQNYTVTSISEQQSDLPFNLDLSQSPLFFKQYQIINANQVATSKLKFKFGHQTVNKILKNHQIPECIRFIYPVIVCKNTNEVAFIPYFYWNKKLINHKNYCLLNLKNLNNFLSNKKLL